MNKSPAQRAAFTLVELSIVLIIIGLLVGGVLTGQSLIRAAELRSVTTDFTNYKTAMGTFRDKYFGLPGDILNATSFWGAAAAPASCSATAGTGTQTCNGNGNGLIYSTAAADDYGEVYRSWQQLKNAGLVGGNFTGLGGPDSDAIPGENVPRSKIANAGWSFIGHGSIATTGGGVFAGSYGTTLYFGAWNDYQYLDIPVLKAEDAYNVDMKIDDGKPHTGTWRTGTNAVVPNCIVATNDAYALTNKAIGCYTIVMTGY